MKESVSFNISRRSVLKKTSVAGLSTGLFSQSSLGALANPESSNLSDLGFEYLKGRNKWSFVFEVLRTDEYQAVNDYLDKRGWTLSFDNIDAFTVERDIKYKGVLMGFAKPDTPKETEAYFMHLQGELPEDREKVSFGLIGKRPTEAPKEGEKATIKETQIVPQEHGSVSVNSTTVELSKNPPDDVSDKQNNEDGVSTADHVPGSTNACIICYQHCRISYNCALTILAAGLGVIGCTITGILTFGITFLICLAGLGITTTQAFACVQDKKCYWIRDRIFRGEFQRKDPTNGETTFHRYCDNWSCERL